MKSVIANGIIGLFVFSSNIIAAPEGDPCQPLIGDVEWDRAGGWEFDFEKVAAILKRTLAFIPRCPEPGTSGKFAFVFYNKKSCCSADAEEKVELRKGEISGTGQTSVDSGILPLPGISLPFGAGGAYIRATASAYLTIAGASEQQCNMSYNKLCVTGEVGGEVTLEGGVNLFGDFFTLAVSGQAKVGGGFEWCEDAGPDWTGVCCTASVSIIGESPFGKMEPIVIAQVTRCGN